VLVTAYDQLASAGATHQNDAWRHAACSPS